MSAPVDADVKLVLYRRGTEEILAEADIPSSPLYGEVRCLSVFDLQPDTVEYLYRINGVLTEDPAAPVIRGRKPFGSGHTAVGGKVRCGFLKEGFDWKGDAPLHIPYEDVIAYGLHVRGFTMHRQSRVTNRGTFRGLQEKIPYLKDLGVNQVILLPACEFDEVVQPRIVMPKIAEPGASKPPARLNYWGFGEACFFAPKYGYCAADDPDIEMKSLVRALHENGIELVMEFSFPDAMPSELVVQCLSFWVREYHVDGFWLMTANDTARIAAQSPLLRNTKLIAGFFDTGRLYPGGKGFSRRVLCDAGDGFRTDCRKILKSDENQLAVFTERMKQNNREKACMNYITSHDGFTLMDLVSYDKKHNEANGEQNQDGPYCDFSWNCGIEGPSRKKSIRDLRLKQRKNAMAVLLLAQGVPLLLAGDEFGNSQQGNNNPYCHDSELTWLEWNQSKQEQELTEFVRKLIAFRKKHKILHMDRPLECTDRISCGYPDFSCHGERAWYPGFDYLNRHVGMMFCGEHAGEEEFIYIACNFHWEKQMFALPYLPKGMNWKMALSTDEDLSNVIRDNEPASPGEHTRECELPGRTVCVLVGSRQELPVNK